MRRVVPHLVHSATLQPPGKVHFFSLRWYYLPPSTPSRAKLPVNTMDGADPPPPLTQADIPALVRAVTDALKSTSPTDSSSSSSDPPGKRVTYSTHNVIITES